MVGNMIGSVIKGTLGGAADLGRVFVGDKAAREGHQHDAYIAAMNQFAAEAARERKTWFDALVDGLNRLPRPLIAFGVIGLFVYAMADPIGFAASMQGVALIPEPMWWIFAAVVSFFFGARELQKMRDARGSFAVDSNAVAGVVENIRQIRALEPGIEHGAAVVDDAPESFVLDNPIVDDWNSMRRD